MWCDKGILSGLPNLLLALLLSVPIIESATVKDIFNRNTQNSPSRVSRDNKYYTGRYGSSSSTHSSPLNRAIKPEDSLEAREATPTPVEKRCIRCESPSYYGYDSPNPYEGRSRYDDRRDRDRGGDYDDRRSDRYDERRTDRYDDRYYDRYDRRPSYDRYDRDGGYERGGYDRYDRDRGYDRYDRDRGYDRYNRGGSGGGYDRYDRDYNRGFGYDNRGYDYRERNDGYRPWDETYRGSSGFDNSGRGYYFATGRPESGGSGGGGGYWGSGGAGGGSGGGGGYASSWNYGGGRDDFTRGKLVDKGSHSVQSNQIAIRDSRVPAIGNDRYGSEGSRGGGYYGGRPRDPYDGGYRTTSYLYGRPSSTTTNRPSNSNNDDTSATQSPSTNNNSSG